MWTSANPSDDSSYGDIESGYHMNESESSSIQDVGVKSGGGGGGLLSSLYMSADVAPPESTVGDDDEISDDDDDDDDNGDDIGIGDDIESRHLSPSIGIVGGGIGHHGRHRGKRRMKVDFVQLVLFLIAGCIGGGVIGLCLFMMLTVDL